MWQLNSAALVQPPERPIARRPIFSFQVNLRVSRWNEYVVQLPTTERPDRPLGRSGHPGGFEVSLRPRSETNTG
jgi:hypothetical protein